jgi:hypothetical protein
MTNLVVSYRSNMQFASLAIGSKPTFDGSIVTWLRKIAGFDDVTVMREAVEQGCGHPGIAKDTRPFAKTEIGRPRSPRCARKVG